MTEDEARDGFGRWRRLKARVEAWPEAQEGDYNPACCRFPKSCSATVYDPAYVTEQDLELRMLEVPTRPEQQQPLLYFDGTVNLAERLRDAWVTQLHRGADEGLWDAVVDIEQAFGLIPESRPGRGVS